MTMATRLGEGCDGGWKKLREKKLRRIGGDGGKPQWGAMELGGAMMLSGCGGHGAGLVRWSCGLVYRAAALRKITRLKSKFFLREF